MIKFDNKTFWRTVVPTFSNKNPKSEKIILNGEDKTKNLNVRKTCQGSDIATKIIKLIIDLFSSLICQNFNYCKSIGEFPNELKHANVIPVHKKRIKVTKPTIGQ